MPHNTNYKFKPEYPDSLIKWMGQGMSYTTWGTAEGRSISTSTIYEWEKQIPEWKEAKEKGYQRGLEFYEKLLSSEAVGVLPESLKRAGSKGINMTAVIFALKTRFHREYGEKQKIDQDTTVKFDLNYSLDESDTEN